MSLYADHSTTELFVPPTQRTNANKGELEIGRSSDGPVSRRAGDRMSSANENALNDDDTV